MSAARPQGSRGLTLIELVVAMSVFALVAVMGLQSLTGMLRQRDRAAAFDSQSAELGQAVAMIRRDLSAALPLLFYPPGARTQSALHALPQASGFAVSAANTRAYAPLGETGLVQRVEYRVDPVTGKLMRRVWATAWPVDGAARGPAVAVLDGVRGLRLRSYWTGVGWIDGLRLAEIDAAPRGREAEGQDAPAVAAEVYSDILPQAMEITLLLEGLGEITILESPQ